MDYAVRITLSAASPTPEYTGGFWAAGVASLSAGAPAVGWTSGKLVSCSQVGESVDIAQGGNYAILSDCTVALTAVGWSTAAAAGVSLHNAMVEVGTLSGTTLVPRWVGYVADMDWTGAVLTLTVESLAGRRHREIPARRLTSDELPNLPQESEGAAVPIVWGSVERMTPPKYSLEREYLGAFYHVSGSVGVERKSTFLLEVPTTEAIKIATVGNVDGSSFAFPATFWENYQAARGGDAYIEVSSGTGAGQTRKIASIGASGTTSQLSWYAITLDYPFSIVPNLDSVLRVFLTTDYVSLAIGDSAEGVVISSEIGGIEYPITSEATDRDGVIVSNISPEFLRDGSFDAVAYVKPENFGVTALTDLVSETGSGAYLTYPGKIKISDTKTIFVADVGCRGRVYIKDIKKSEGVKSIAALFSIALTPDSVSSRFIFHVTAEKYSGEIVAIESYKRVVLPDSDEWNGYPVAIASDGSIYNYETNALKIDIPGLLDSYSAIRVGVSVEGFVPAYTTYSWTFAQASTGGIASGSTTFRVRVVPDVDSVAPIIGTKVAPLMLTGTARQQYIADRLYYPDADNGTDTLEFFGISPSDWRTVTGVATVSGLPEYRDVTVDSSWFIDYPSAWVIQNNFGSSQRCYVTERECGIAPIYGQASPSSEFLASVESGRNLPSDDPIVNADDAALDMLSTDLGLVSADIDSTGIGALNSRPIHAVIGSPEMSSDIYARMCREFNWIAAHDATGRETAKNWLGSLGAASQDYSVANSDIIEDSIEGPQMTAIEDVISMPTVSRSWTQADGFRQVASVLSFDIDPGDLDSDNYLQYMTGWDSFAQASEAYAILYANRAKYGIEQRGNVEYKYTSDIQTLLIDENLLHWLSARKEILEFSVRDNHAGAFATLGKRFAVTHRRYAPSAKRGTLVARYWNPEKRTVQLTVMIDP